MAKIETYACDICGAQKGKTNHWYVGFVGPDYFSVTTWRLTGPAEKPWHLCGSQCLLEWVSQTVDKLSGAKEG